MLDKQRLEHDLLREALRPTEGCLPLETLESALVHGEPGLSPEVAHHLKVCGYCQTELHLLKEFHEAGSAKDSEEVRNVVKVLRERSREIFQERSSRESRKAWWNHKLLIQWLVPAALAVAALLIIVAGVSQYRHSARPALNGSFQTQDEVFRTGSFTLFQPVGDLLERPKEVRWEPVKGAVKYEIRLLEVAGADVWNSATTADHIGIPQAVRDKVVPARTLFCEVVAFDSSGRKMGDTGLVRFRLVLHGGTR